VLLAFGLQLPAVPPSSPPGGQSVPPAVTSPVTSPVASTSWTTAWSHALGESPADLHLALSRDFVFVAGLDVALEARTAASGDVVWRHTNLSWTALTATGDLVLGVSVDHAYALDAASGRTRWVTETTGANTMLVVNQRHLLMVSDSDLLLREVETGTPRWRVALSSPSTAVALNDGTVVVAQRDGVVRSLEVATGRTRWETRLSSAALALSTAAPVVYVGLSSGAFCALNDRNGGERWCFSLRVPMAGPPAVDDDVVRVALLDNSLRDFDRLNGAMRQPSSLGHRPASGPWLAGAEMVVALTTGEFVVLDRASGRTLGRLQVPGAAGTHLLEEAAISGDGHTLASVTIAPGGEQRLSVYRRAPAGTLPLTSTLPASPAVTLAPRAARPIATPGAAPPVPRPFPAPR